MEVNAKNYQQFASSTESYSVPKDSVIVLPNVSYILSELLRRAIDTAQSIDLIKKAIYYGKEVDVLALRNLMELDDTNSEFPSKGFSLTPEQYRILHSCLGLLTEAGEMAEGIRANLVDGKPLDKVNIMEEISDGLWYAAIPANVYGWTFEQMMQANIDKLRKRYPEGWTQEKALNRDLEAERKVLEKHQNGSASD